MLVEKTKKSIKKPILFRKYPNLFETAGPPRVPLGPPRAAVSIFFFELFVTFATTTTMFYEKKNVPKKMRTSDVQAQNAKTLESYKLRTSSLRSRMAAATSKNNENQNIRTSSVQDSRHIYGHTDSY